jgi:hypothetical protein
MNYLKGKENWLIRMYFYITRGNGEMRNFKELVFGVMALYALLKLTNPLWMIWVILGILPIQAIVGWYSVHRMGIVVEWLSTKFSTVFQKNNFDNVEKTVKLLEEIKDKIK